MNTSAASDHELLLSASRQTARALRRLLEGILAVVLVAGAIAASVSVHMVADNRMAPTLQVEQIVLVSRLPTLVMELRRGDVVLLRTEDGAEHLSRVVALPGDKVQLDESGIQVNNQPLPAASLNGTLQLDQPAFSGARILRANELFVLNDNSADARDSRAFGPVSAAQLVGRAWLVVWPLDSAGLVQHRTPE
ncbi:MAG: signal peptidase I [Thermoflexales bacterium]